MILDVSGMWGALPFPSLTAAVSWCDKWEDAVESRTVVVRGAVSLLAPDGPSPEAVADYARLSGAGVGAARVLREGEPGVAAWAVTGLAHPAVREYRAACLDCLAQVRSAIVQARITGSTGATFAVEDTDGTTHSATVARAVGGVYEDVQ